MPPRDEEGRTLWVTRTTPKIDRIACPWLIRRFIDTFGVFPFVAPSEVADVAGQFCATAFDIKDVFWSHRGEACTFDVMLQAFGLVSIALARLSDIVRGADTGCVDLALEAAGPVAASLGLSHMFRRDLEKLDAAMVLYAAMVVYDAFYRWSRDATNETQNWPAAQA